MKILLLNPNTIHRHNWGHQLLKNEFGRQHDVVYYGPRFDNFTGELYVPRIINNLESEPDLILIYETKYAKDFVGLGEVTNIPKALIQIDYAKATKNWKGFARHENIDSYIKRNKYDIIFVVNKKNVIDLKKNLDFENVHILPFCVDTNLYYNHGLKRTIDVMASFSKQSHIYPDRVKLISELKAAKDINVFDQRVIHDEYIKHINMSKIFAHAGNFNKRLNMKYFEALACGTLFVTDRPHDMMNYLGFKNKRHLVIYENIKDAEKKIRYYLESKEERERIAKRGMGFVRKNHSCEVRVREFTEIVQRELGIGKTEMKIVDYGSSLCWQKVCDSKDVREEVLDKVKLPKGRILEIGCAKGNFAKRLAKRGRHSDYLGVDINEQEVSAAKDRLPSLKFMQADVLADSLSDIFKEAKTLVAFQVLEHLGTLPNFKTSDGAEDVAFLSKIPSGTKIIFSVPNFDYKSEQPGGHMRWFEAEGWVSRYKDQLDFLECWKINHCKKKDKRIFLFVATKR